tara:strand:+ start:114 stop:431 length:318 start_codon:yes stop_codon:yes gene_type:complete
MTAPKWTPGPWDVRPGWGLNAIEVAPVDDAPDLVGEPTEVAGISDCYTEHEANAHLIAAAPELYEALESLVGQIDGACGDVLPAGAFSLARKKAHAALANALGEI